MSDIGADEDAAVLLVEAAEDRLIVKQKDHPLIAYLFIKNKKEREIAWQKQLRSFSRDPSKEGNVRGAMEVTYAMTCYLMALEVALGERESTNETKPKDGAVATTGVTFNNDGFPF
jgi:hypothetical protein